jgi:WD40 repeat protein
MRTALQALAGVVLVALLVSLLLRVVVDPPPRVFDDTGEERPVLVPPPPPAWAVAGQLQVPVPRPRRGLLMGMMGRRMEGFVEQTALAFSPDGKHALAGDGRFALRLWDLEQGKAVRWLQLPTPAVGDDRYTACVAFTPDGKRFVCGGGDNILKLGEVFTGRLVREFKISPARVPIVNDPRPGVFAVAVSADGEYVLAGYRDETLRLWELDSGELVRTIYAPGPVEGVALSPDGRWALSSGFNSMNAKRETRFQLWDVATGKLVRHFVGHTGWVTAVSFSPDGRRVLSGSTDGTVGIWDRGSGRLLQSMRSRRAEGEAVWSVAFLPSGRFVLAGGGKMGLALWELASGEEVVSFEDNPCDVKRVAVSHDGRRALSWSRANHLILWDLTTGEEVRTLQGPGFGKPPIAAVAFSPDGKLAAAVGQPDGWHWSSLYTEAASKGIKVPSSRGIVTLYEIRTGRVVSTLRGRTIQGSPLAFLPDGKRLLTVSDGGRCNCGTCLGGKVSACSTETKR